jgi:YHS domain-containing protein
MKIRQAFQAAFVALLTMGALSLTACDRSPSEGGESEAASSSAEQEAVAEESGTDEAQEAAEAEQEAEPADEAMEGHGDEANGMQHHGHEDMEHTLSEGDYEPSDVVLQPGAEVGDIAQCPVSGEVFRVTEDHTYFDVDEGRVYFCCPNCIRRFQRDPERWLSTQDVAVEE